MAIHEASLNVVSVSQTRHEPQRDDCLHSRKSAQTVPIMGEYTVVYHAGGGPVGSRSNTPLMATIGKLDSGIDNLHCVHCIMVGMQVGGGVNGEDSLSLNPKKPSSAYGNTSSTSSNAGRGLCVMLSCRLGSWGAAAPSVGCYPGSVHEGLPHYQ